MGMILKHSRSRGTSRLVAVVIGDCCEDDGTGAWPAIHTIAARAGTSQRTAQRSLGDLQELGELEVFENAAPNGSRSNLYKIRIDRLLANPPSEPERKPARVANRQGGKSTGMPKRHPVRQRKEGCQDAPAEGDRIEAEGDTAMAPDPSFRSIRDPSADPPDGDAAGLPSVYSDDFEEFWRAFPRKDGKREALKAWKKLSGSEKASATADVPRRMKANWAGRELDKIPHAATYLNQRRWEDDLAENRVASPAPPRLSPGRQAAFESIRRLEAREASNGTVSGGKGSPEGQHYLDAAAHGRGGAS